jgi:hypothetical protein
MPIKLDMAKERERFSEHLGEPLFNTSMTLIQRGLSAMQARKLRTRVNWKAPLSPFC